MAQKSDATLTTDLAATFADASDITAAELRGQQTDIIDSKVNVADVGALASGDDATDVPFTPSGNIAATDVDGAIQELDSEKADAATVAEIDDNADDLITLSGVAENATNLGTFTGGTIPDSQTIKQALQALEDGVEANAAEFERTVSLTGGTTTLAEATHRNAMIVLASGTNTVAAPSSDTGTWVCTVKNDTATDQTVAGQTVSAGSITTVVCQGTTATPYSTSQVKLASIYIPEGADAVLWQGAPLLGYPVYTFISVQHQTISGTITLNFELEDDTDSDTFSSITSLSAVSLSSTKSTATASGANVSDDGARQLRITGSSNSSATGIILSMRIRV